MDQVLANAHRPGDGAAEPGAGLRAADHRLSRDELLDGLQLAHLLAERDLAGADGGLSVAGVRQPVRQPRQPAEPEHSRPRAASEAAGLSRQVSAADQAKLDEYLTSVREVEKRVDRMRARQGQGRRERRGPRPARRRDAAARQRPAGRHPRAHAADVRHRRARLPDRQDARRHAAACAAISPACSIRSSTSARRTTPASHDDLSDDYERVSRYYVSQLAYLAGRLDAMPEGDGTVLDNSCLLFISNMWSGSKHDSTQAAGPAGRRPGRHARNRPRARLPRTRATTTASSAACISRSWTAWACKLDRFGDADTRLAGL